MTDTRPPKSSPPSRGTWIGICVLLAPAVVLPLLVPLYAKEDPTLFGFPFYFWFQLALIPVRGRAHRRSRTTSPRAPTGVTARLATRRRGR